MSSRIGYTRRHWVHFRPSPFSVRFTCALQSGQTRIFKSSGFTGMAKILPQRRPSSQRRGFAQKSRLSTVAPVYGAVKKLGGGPSPSGRGRREAPDEGRKSSQILRPSPYPLPEGEGESSAITIFHIPYDRRRCRKLLWTVGGHRPPLQLDQREIVYFQCKARRGINSSVC